MIHALIKKTKYLHFEVSTIQAGREYETLVFDDRTGDAHEETRKYSVSIEGALQDHLDALSDLVEVYGG